MKLWIARDKNGSIYLHREKPSLFAGAALYDSADWWMLKSNDFPEITYENSPQEVEFKLIEK